MEVKMREKSFLLVLMAVLLLLSACSEKDKPTDTTIYGYKLDQFVSADSVTAYVDASAELPNNFRHLFNYEIVGEDGFSPRASSNAGYDLSFGQFSEGYLVPTDDGKTWFPTLDLPGAFKVRDTAFFRLYRKVDVDDGLRGSKSIELRGLNVYNMPNWDSEGEDAIKLADLLQGIATYDSVAFVAVDDYTKVYTPELVNDGYYFMRSEVTSFPSFNAQLPGAMKKFKKLARIVVYGASGAQNHDFPLANNTLADMVFQVPADLSGYERVIMESN